MTVTKSALRACGGNEAAAGVLMRACESAASGVVGPHQIMIGDTTFYIDALGMFASVKG